MQQIGTVSTNDDYFNLQILSLAKIFAVCVK